ncbi:MAG: EAL domain-containing protein [Sphingobium sp.]|nr:EAL domain-containing protein [Sphingobium sp.]
MDGSEELRETLVAMSRENDILRTEATHANLLLHALDAMLCIDGEENPFARVFEALLPTFDAQHAIVLIERDDDHDMLECMAASDEALVGTLWPVGRSFTKILSGRIVTTISNTDSSDWPEIAAACLPGQRPALYLPLGVRDRRGLLILLRGHAEPGFDRSHVNLARKFSLLASHAFAATWASQTEAESFRLKQLTERLKASKEELTYRANHDQLTGLPNRSYIEELVNRSIENKKSGEKMAIAFVDLDHFKQVNDFYGHHAGDALLKAVADRVRSQIRKTDFLGRISGDEFVIVLNPIEGRPESAALIERIKQQLKVPFNVDGLEIRASASIGVALYPAHGQDYETLRRNADTAMYQAKMTSKGSIGFFNQALGKVAAQKISIEHRLRAAIHRNEFQCALQAKVDLRDGSVFGFETLVRWVDGQGTVHPPCDFLNLASDLGLMDGITHAMLDRLIEALPRLDERFGRDITYSLNISARQADKTAFMEKFIRRIVDTGRARNFILELTEDAFVTSGPFQARIFPLLREVGIGISIDDFGTGYSCLSLLADISADEMKVDRSLIASIHQRPRSQSVLRAIESLSLALGMQMVAEGVEVQEERDYLLNETGIRAGQGFLFHKPQFVDELLEQSGLNGAGMPALSAPMSAANIRTAIGGL